MKTEDWFKGGLCSEMREIMPGSVVLRHEDQFTPGIPDISSSWIKHTIWIEAKAVCPTPGRELRTTGKQVLTCTRLEGSSSWCRYLVWLEDEHGPCWLTIKPSTLARRLGMGQQVTLKIPARCVRELAEAEPVPGHSFGEIAAWLRQKHEILGRGGFVG